MKSVKIIGTILVFMGMITTVHAWKEPTHSRIVRDALAYMGSENASAEQKRAYNIYVAAAGSEKIAAKALEDAVAIVDEFHDTNLGSWWTGYNYQPGKYSVGGIALALYDLEVNYTSYWHYIDFKSEGDIHGNKHGGYYSPKTLSGSLEDRVAALYLSPYKLKKSDYYTTEAHYRQGSSSSYKRDYQNFDEMPFQPVSHLGMYWFSEFKKYPTYAVIGHSLHAIGDAAQPHHVYVSIGHEHAGWEAWVEANYEEMRFYNESKVSSEVAKYNARDSFSDITLQTGEQAYSHPEVLSNLSTSVRRAAAEELIPVAIAASVTVLTKGINHFFGQGGK